MRRRTPTIAALLVIVALLASGCFWNKDKPGPGDLAQAFLTAWSGEDIPNAAAQTDAPDDTATMIQQLAKGLGAGAKLTTTRDAVTDQDDTHATAAYTADWTLPGSDQHWRYNATLPLVKTGDNWLVQWQPTDLHPDLTAETVDAVAVTHTLPDRAALQDAAGAPIFARTPVVTVGVQPARSPHCPRWRPRWPRCSRWTRPTSSPT